MANHEWKLIVKTDEDIREQEGKILNTIDYADCELEYVGDEE